MNKRILRLSVFISCIGIFVCCFAKILTGNPVIDYLYDILLQLTPIWLRSQSFEYPILSFIFYSLMVYGTVIFRSSKGTDYRILGLGYGVILLGCLYEVVLFPFWTYYKTDIYLNSSSGLNESFRLFIFNSILRGIILCFYINQSYKIISFWSKSKDVAYFNELGTTFMKEVPTSNRLTHFFVDILCFSALFYFVLFEKLVILIDSNQFLYRYLGNLGMAFLSALFFYFLYYYFFESQFKKTPGKFMTNAMVRTEYGEIPTNNHIIKRTFIRFFPGDLRSFFKYHVGYHDEWSNTRVIKESHLREFGTLKGLFFTLILAAILFLYLLYF